MFLKGLKKKPSVKDLEKIKELVKKGKITLKPDERPECLHKKLRKIHDMWYQCEDKKCGIVFYLFGCVSYRKENLKVEFDKILKEVK